MEELIRRIYSLHNKYFESLTGMEEVHRQLGGSLRLHCYPYDAFQRKGVLQGIAGVILKDKYEFMIVDMLGGESKVVITKEI